MSTYADHIVGFERMAPDALGANPANFRVHPDGQRTAWRAIAEKVGWLGALIWNKRTGHLIDGHLRLEEALASGQETVPVLVVDCDADTEAQGLLTFDAMGELAEKDDQALDSLLREVGSMGPELDAMLADLAREVGLYDDKPSVVEDEVPEAPADPVTQPGDVWLLGRHRLICGDCTDAEVVARVMGGEKAEMVLTDPPYGVAIGDKNKYLNSIAPSNRVEENLENDTLGEDGLIEMLGGSFGLAQKHCLAGGAWYVAAPAGPLHVLFGQVLKDAGIWHQTIQWVKNNATFSPMGVDYHWRAEPIFYGWLPGAGHRYYGGRKQDTVWEIDRPSASPDHPTMKPVELFARAVENSSKPGEIVYDPFLGSGTTLIAAEQLGRTCYGCEISPVYCDVVVKRWEALTGQTATREVTSCG